MGLLDKVKTMLKSHVKENFDPSIFKASIASVLFGGIFLLVGIGVI